MIGKIPKEEFARTASLLLDRTEIALGAVALYGSVRDRLFANSHGLEGCGYDEWKGFTDRNDPWRGGCPEVQEAVKIGPNILLRTVDRDCRKSTSLVKGNADPLELVVNGKRVRVLHPELLGWAGQGEQALGACRDGSSHRRSRLPRACQGCDDSAKGPDTRYVPLNYP